jgi:Family of unknown function (DUF6541)
MEIARLALSALAIFLFPGYAVLTAFRKYRQAGVAEVLCASVGLSIAVVPLLLYACTLAGWRLNPVAAGAILLAAGGVFVWDLLQRATGSKHRPFRAVSFYDIGLGLVFLMTLGARLWTVRGIDYPLWTDSYHHTLISELIATQGMVPDSYVPYAPIPAFTYHFGFHTLVAWFHWLSGVPIPRSVVLVGQIINALAVPTCYLFTWRLMHSRRAALVAAIIVGLLSHMPAQFVNWGRYPQLAGQVLLPVLIVLTIDALESRGRALGQWLLVGVGAAGLLLVHVRIALFYGVLAILLFVYYAVKRPRQSHQIGRLLIGGLVMLTTAILIDVPWLLRFFHGFGAMVAREVVSGYRPETAGAYFTITVQDLFYSGMRPLWLVLAGISAVWGLLKRCSGVWLLVIWVILLFGAANLHLIGLTPLFSSLIVTICLYLPVAALVGYGADRLVDWLAPFFSISTPRARVLGATAVAVVFAAIGVCGMAYTSRVIEPENGFVRPADLEAMRWIQQNTPQDALFHISTHFWTPQVAHGLDAGYWIPLLANRQVTIPPEIYASDGSDAYIASTNERLLGLVQAKTPQQMWQVLREDHVTHIYIGNRSANLRPEFFNSDPTHFRPVYARDSVWIYEVMQ